MMGVWGVTSSAWAEDVDEDVWDAGELIFETHCVACHTIGDGKLIGPDLEGVTERREREWLLGYIKEPSKYLYEIKDPIAVALLKEHIVPMTDLGLTEEEVEAVVTYLENPDF